MLMTVRFGVNSPNVIGETIQGEVIIIHMETGSYYSLRGAGAEIWTAIESESTHDEIVEMLAGRHEGSRGEIESALAQLLAELRGEELVVAVNGERKGSVAAAMPAPPAKDNREPFVAPKLEKFTDMQDLILLDPVHQVDARGWPHAAPADAEHA